MSRFLRPAREQPLLEAVDDDLRLRALRHPFADRGDDMLGVLQARHRHFADDEQPVRAAQHVVGPGEPGARHVDHDILEMRRDQIEQLGHDVGVEGAHLRRTRRRCDHGKAGGVIGGHHLQQLLVEAVRPRLDLRQVETRLEVEIIGAGAVLQIEVDETGRGAAARAARQQQQRGLDRKRGDAGTADRRDEREDLRLRRLRLPPASTTRAQVRISSTGETGFTRKSAIFIWISVRATWASKSCVTTTIGGQPPVRIASRSQRLHLVVAGGIEIDHDDGRAVRGRSGRPRPPPSPQQVELDLRAGG